MFILVRTVVYATLFIGLVLVMVPAALLSWAGVSSPSDSGAAQVVGLVLTAMGGALALWCILTFAFAGKGTPAPFDPPRRLVTQGPYGFIRNPMYVGAGVVLVGVAILYQSTALAIYTVLFLVATHEFVTRYEEPTLGAAFGTEYVRYRARVPRWLPWPRQTPPRS